MIALIQRVNWANIEIDGDLHAAIDQGLLAFIGVEKADDEVSAERLLDKLLAYRVFADADGKMNLSLNDTGGALMLVSQFTLAASTDKGLRPGFSSAKPPQEAERLYAYLVDAAGAKHAAVRSGRFAANLQISLQNDGPVTFILRV